MILVHAGAVRLERRAAGLGRGEDGGERWCVGRRWWWCVMASAYWLAAAWPCWQHMAHAAVRAFCTTENDKNKKIKISGTPRALSPLSLLTTNY